jgi:hypothetical protein
MYRCEDCFDTATHAVAEYSSTFPEYYCDECMDLPINKGLILVPLHTPSKGYMEYLPADGNFTEDDLWEAIAEANGVDASEIMDGDLCEWL